MTVLPGGNIFVLCSRLKTLSLSRTLIRSADDSKRSFTKRWRLCRVAKCLHFKLYTQFSKKYNIFAICIALCAVYLQLKFVYAWHIVFILAVECILIKHFVHMVTLFTVSDISVFAGAWKQHSPDDCGGVRYGEAQIYVNPFVRMCAYVHNIRNIICFSVEFLNAPFLGIRKTTRIFVVIYNRWLFQEKKEKQSLPNLLIASKVTCYDTSLSSVSVLIKIIVLLFFPSSSFRWCSIIHHNKQKTVRKLMTRHFECAMLLLHTMYVCVWAYLCCKHFCTSFTHTHT